MARFGRRQPNKPVVTHGDNSPGNPAVATPVVHNPIVHQTNARRAGRALVTHGQNLLGHPAVATTQPIVHSTSVRHAGRILLAHGLMAAVVAAQPAAPAPHIHQTNARRAGRQIVIAAPKTIWGGYGSGGYGNGPYGGVGGIVAQPIIAGQSRHRAGRIIVIRQVGGAAASVAAHPAPHIHQTNARRAGAIRVLRTPLVSTTVFTAAHPPPIVHQTNARRAGHTLVTHGSNVLGLVAQPTAQPQIWSVGARRPGRIIVTHGNNILGSLVVPTATPKPHVITRTNRRPAATIRIVTPDLLGNPAQSSPGAQILLSTILPHAGRQVLINPRPAPVVVSNPPAAAPIVHETNARRAGRTIVTHGNNILGAPAVASPKPHVYQTNARRAGRQIVARPEGMLGLFTFTAAHPAPVIVSRSTRRAGHAIIVRTAGAVGVPAVSSPQPHIVTRSSRRPAVIRVLQAPQVPPIVYTAAHPPPIVIARSPRHPGHILVTHGDNTLGIPAKPTPNARVHVTNARRPAVIVVLRTSLLPVLHDIGIVTSGVAAQNILTADVAAQDTLTGDSA